MTKQDVKLEAFLTVISPQQTVRILDEELTPPSMVCDNAEITLFKGTAVKAFREYAGKGLMIKHIAPQVEKETADNLPRYVMHIYIYR